MFTTAETFIFDNHFMPFAHIHPAHTEKTYHWNPRDILGNRMRRHPASV